MLNARRTRFQLVQILFFAVAFPSVSHAEPRRPTHIACVGDSITFGYLASAGKDYPSVLQGLVGESVQVENFGFNAATMLKSGNLPYWDQTAFDDATEFVDGAGANAVVSVVILLGANDSKPVNWNSAQFIADYEAMVDHFAGLSTKPVVYVGLPLATGNNPCCEISGTVIHDEQVPLIKTLATDKHLPVIDLNTPTLSHPEYFSDGVHPTDAGYAILADLVRAGLNREPSVSFSSPGDGANLGSPLSLEALASGDTVSITEVEFFEGETSLGAVGTAPFSLEWPATPGKYTLTVKATDSTLATATSDPIEITVTDEPPAPTGGSGGTGNGGGAGGAAGTAGTSAGSGNAAGNGGTPSSSGGQPSSGSGGSDAEPSPPADTSDTSGGCGCRLALGNVSQSAAGFALVVASLLFARRRGRRELRTKSLM